LATKLATSCTTPFAPAKNSAPAKAECRTSDITTAEFLSLRGKPDAANIEATSPTAYVGDGPRGALLTHTDSIALFRNLGVKFTPELKAPTVSMPFEGLTQEAYAQALIDEYKAAGIPSEDVWPQSFDLANIRYWIANEPAFGAQAVFLDGRYRSGLNPLQNSTFSPEMAALKASGVNYIAPPMWMLLTLDGDRIVPSPYAISAREAGLKIITWTLERSDDLTNGGGWYYRSITSETTNIGATYEALHVLAQDVGVIGVFSDWPETVTYYANCMGLD
jgi:glycerophosphoryl diester phosphodiesterase